MSGTHAHQKWTGSARDMRAPTLARMPPAVIKHAVAAGAVTAGPLPGSHHASPRSLLGRALWGLFGMVLRLLQWAGGTVLGVACKTPKFMLQLVQRAAHYILTSPLGRALAAAATSVAYLHWNCKKYQSSTGVHTARMSMSVALLWDMLRFQTHLELTIPTSLAAWWPPWTCAARVHVSDPSTTSKPALTAGHTPAALTLSSSRAGMCNMERQPSGEVHLVCSQELTRTILRFLEQQQHKPGPANGFHLDSPHQCDTGPRTSAQQLLLDAMQPPPPPTVDSGAAALLHPSGSAGDEGLSATIASTTLQPSRPVQQPVQQAQQTRPPSQGKARGRVSGRLSARYSDHVDNTHISAGSSHSSTDDLQSLHQAGARQHDQQSTDRRHTDTRAAGKAHDSDSQGAATAWQTALRPASGPRHAVGSRRHAGGAATPRGVSGSLQSNTGSHDASLMESAALQYARRMAAQAPVTSPQSTTTPPAAPAYLRTATPAHQASAVGAPVPPHAGLLKRHASADAPVRAAAGRQEGPGLGPPISALQSALLDSSAYFQPGAAETAAAEAVYRAARWRPSGSRSGRAVGASASSEVRCEEGRTATQAVASTAAEADAGEVAAGPSGSVTNVGSVQQGEFTTGAAHADEAPLSQGACDQRTDGSMEKGSGDAQQNDCTGHSMVSMDAVTEACAAVTDNPADTAPVASSTGGMDTAEAADCVSAEQGEPVVAPSCTTEVTDTAAYSVMEAPRAIPADRTAESLSPAPAATGLSLPASSKTEDSEITPCAVRTNSGIETASQPTSPPPAASPAAHGGSDSVPALPRHPASAAASPASSRRVRTPSSQTRSAQVSRAWSTPQATRSSGSRRRPSSEVGSPAPRSASGVPAPGEESDDMQAPMRALGLWNSLWGLH